MSITREQLNEAVARQQGYDTKIDESTGRVMWVTPRGRLLFGLPNFMSCKATAWKILWEIIASGHHLLVSPDGVGELQWLGDGQWKHGYLYAGPDDIENVYLLAAELGVIKVQR